MKVSLITGAASGLGLEFAKLFAKENNNLLLVDVNEEKLKLVKDQLTNQYNVNVDILKKDLSMKEQLKEVYEYTIKNNYFVNNLINCAGFGDRTDFLEMDIDKQMVMTDVDCNAVLYFTKVFLDNMIKNDEGHIINISSIAGFLPGPYMCTYHACKAYVLLLGEAISHEIRKTNVNLLTLCPGPFISNFVKEAGNDYTFKKIKPVTAEYVAKYGFKKSKKNKSLAIVGFKNRISIFLCRLFPRKIITSISAKNMKKENL